MSTPSFGITITPSKLPKQILMARAANRPLFIWGPPGIGKSAVILQVANSINSGLFDVRMAQMEPSDVRGIPAIVERYGIKSVEWSIPSLFPRDLDFRGRTKVYRDGEVIEVPNRLGDNGIYAVKAEDITVEVRALDIGQTAHYQIRSGGKVEVWCEAPYTDDQGNTTNVRVDGTVAFTMTGLASGIILLDEMNSADPSVLTPCYQLLNEGRIGDYIVPEGVSIVAAGNRESDKGTAFQMPTPVLNRMIHVELEHSFPDWQNWAIGARLNSSVLGFLTAFESCINKFDAKDAATQKAFATPRSWAAVAAVLDSNPHATEDELAPLIMGAVGSSVGQQFITFIRAAISLPSANEVLSGKTQRLTDDLDTSLAFALTTNLCYALRQEYDDITRKNAGRAPAAGSAELELWQSRCDNFVEFALRNYETELQVMAIRTALKQHQLMLNHRKIPKLGEMLREHKDLILAK